MKHTSFMENHIEQIPVLQNMYAFEPVIEAHFERLAQLTSLICDTSIVLITFIDQNKQWYRSNKSITAEDIAIENNLYLRTIQSTDIVEFLNVSTEHTDND